MRFIKLIFLLVFSLAIFSCQKENFYNSSNAELVFSTDTIMFDTIFTNIGSSTQSFTVHNPYNKTVNISSISLAGSNNSVYRLNIDGYSGNELHNIELKAKDSLYIFAEVTIDPNNSNLPLVIKDSIIFTTNNNKQYVNLISWGQDVYLINGEIIQTQTWQNDKPYLIYNSMLVDTNSLLTIESGARLYFHNKSRLYVAGTLIANGTLDEPILFSGDRIEEQYSDIPGQWDGIWFMSGSKNNILSYSVINNAIIGIQVDTFTNITKPTLDISNTRIENMTSAGIYAQGSTIKAYNCLISNCGQYAIALTLGGDYEFNHCTIANYWNYSTRSTPSLLINNYYTDINNNIQLRPLNNATFGNCIIYGNKENEIVLDNDSNTNFNFKFDHCLIKTNIQTENANNFENIIKNITPNFISKFGSDYQLDTLSVAKDYGKIEIGELFPIDINGNSRISDNGPDLGSFERIEK